MNKATCPLAPVQYPLVGIFRNFAEHAAGMDLAQVHHHAYHTTLAIRSNEHPLSGSGQPAEALAVVGVGGVFRVTGVGLRSVPN